MNERAMQVQNKSAGDADVPFDLESYVPWFNANVWGDGSAPSEDSAA